jgi:hypothetical protein
MVKIKSFDRLMCLGMSLLCLGACSSTPEKPAKPTFSGGGSNVVLLDPTTDDSMLPALGEGLSRGAVTIYALDGAPAPLPANVAIHSMGQAALSAPLPTSTTVQLRPIKALESNSISDPRVTVFDLTRGIPVTQARAPERLAPATPVLPPPVAAQPKALHSPFTPSGSLKPPGPPPIPGQTTGSGNRAVTAQDMMIPTAPVDPVLSPPPVPVLPAEPVAKTPPRPPRGMTY